ncbi:YbhN family protein [uncultured Bradyrhizobium sp.]|uniref:lysylphosphatidylglycerol synthase transmembrane domain-containing protein n=1 Tax=uncultured Bradyrhizobium sp. TaxID=199684 RepID=UPI0035CAE9BA
MKSKLKGLIGLLSSLLLLGLIFVLLRAKNADSLLEAWRRLGFLSLFIAVTCVLGTTLAGAWRLQAIMAISNNAKSSLASLLRLQLVSQFVAHGAPISALADVAKVAILSLRFNLSPGASLRVVVYERVLGAIAIICLGSVAFGFQFLVSVPLHVLKVEALVWATGILGIMVLLGLSRFKIVTGIGLLDKAIRGIFTVGHLLFRPRLSVTLLISSAVQLLLMATAFLVLAESMHLVVSPLQLILFMPFVFFVASLPIFYLGWGGREAAVVLTLGSVSSMTSSEAVALSVAFGVCVLLAALPGGVFWLMRPSMRKAASDRAAQLQTLSEEN